MQTTPRIGFWLDNSNQTPQQTVETILNVNNRWVGFNSNGNYLNSPPEKDCFGKSAIIMPGTAYNLNFVLKREENNEQTNNNT